MAVTLSFAEVRRLPEKTRAFLVLRSFNQFRVLHTGTGGLVRADGWAGSVGDCDWSLQLDIRNAPTMRMSAIRHCMRASFRGGRRPGTKNPRELAKAGGTD